MAALPGADREHRGFFERAHGGTLFLDEITEMPIDLQVRLLRVLETRRVLRLGGSSEIDVDVRIVAATNRDPLGAIDDGELRHDLYHRINVFPIPLPPLRERGRDVVLLAEAFLARFNEAMSRALRFSEDAKEALTRPPLARQRTRTAQSRAEGRDLRRGREHRHASGADS